MPHTTALLMTPAALAAALMFGLGACARPDTGTTSDGAPIAAAGSEATGPGLAVGERVGGATLQDAAGNAVSLASLYSDRPVVVTFYRGGWCPYCNRALTEWEGRVAELEALGVGFVAITPERPDETLRTAEKTGAEFRILSDANFEAADAFRVRFTLDQDTQTRYKGYGVDLAQHNAAGLWDLPAPGTFLIDRSGVVRYAWADWDYRQRAEPDEVIAAARALP
ncbi:MAG: AhpC/TSA family protein [Phycisphaerales bacterium]|nr:AhpC/TSA family protein [Phycisphaerales bacterium]